MFNILFAIHAFIWHRLVRYTRQITLVLLILAHLVLLGLLFPSQAVAFGSFAISLLFVILFMSPIAHATRMPLLMYLLRFRRPLGIAMAYAALVHGFGIMSNSVFFQYVFRDNWPQAFLGSWQLLLGVAALILVLPLLFTANGLAVKKLGKKWKKLHRLVYLVFVAAVIHQSLAEVSTLSSAILRSLPIIIIYIYLKVLVKYHQALPGLPKFFDYINKKYLAYQDSFQIGTASSNQNSRQ